MQLIFHSDLQSVGLTFERWLRQEPVMPFELFNILLMSLQRYGVVVAVWIFIVLDFAAYFSIYLYTILFSDNTLFWLVGTPFVWCTTTVIYTYYMSIFTSPGNPPSNINDSYDDLESIKIRAKQEQEIKKTLRKKRYQPNEQLPEFDEIQSLGRTSYCFKCQKVKEIRTHHCKICGTCILRMDHHCPWVGNCVGLHNHKYFIQFLFAATVGLLIVFFTIAADFFMGQPILGNKGQVTLLIIYSSCVASGLMGLAIGFLLCTQLYSLAKNVTTIESFVELMMQREPWRKDTFKQNMEQIMGKSNWCWPSAAFSRAKPYSAI